MTEEMTLQQAVETAWSVYLATHCDVDTADQRRCSLSRHLEARLQAGENNTEELACAGLAYLDRVPGDVWLKRTAAGRRPLLLSYLTRRASVPR